MLDTTSTVAAIAAAAATVSSSSSSHSTRKGSNSNRTLLIGLLCAVVLYFYTLNTADQLIYREYAYTMIHPFKYIVWDVLKPAITELLKTNQFAQVFVFGSLTAYSAYLLNVVYRLAILPIFLNMKSSIVIHNTDPNFYAVMDFIADNLMKDTKGSQFSLQANTKTGKKTRKDYIQEWLGTESKSAEEVVYRPDNDQVIHKLHYKGWTIFMERWKSSNPIMSHDAPFTPESLKLSVWGGKNDVLKELFAESIASSFKQRNNGSLSIYTLSSCSWLRGWELARTKRARPKDSVILDMDDMDTLLDDARRFLKGGKWYVDMGIPYRRGYLLYGPPGCGKTSFVQVLAGELHLDLCILNLNHQGLNDAGLTEYLNDAPANSVIVLEDVDAIFMERTSVDKNNSASVTFSGLLNALDGVASQEGRILFMTTNHIEKLDPALIRPGRCDLQLEIRLASKNQMDRMFLRFFPTEVNLAKSFASRLPAYEISMATLQGYFLKHRNSPVQCLENAHSLLKASNEEDTTPRRSIYEHLHRVGLEQYTSLFEFQGIYYVDQINTVKLDDLLKMSVELQYDPSAKRFLKLLLEGSTDERRTFEKDSYALAEVSQIRDIFMASYASLIEDDISSTSLLLEDLTMVNSIPLPHDQIKLSCEQLRSLSKVFCQLLSKEGRGIISLYNLRRLIDAHPNRPIQCVRAAHAFTDPRSEESKIVKHMPLYQFVKRAGMKEIIHNLEKAHVNTVRELMESKEDAKISDLTPKWKKAYKLTLEEAFTLAEIGTSTNSDSGNLLQFALFPRSRIMNEFILFYTIGSRTVSNGSNEDVATVVNSKLSKNELEALAYEFSLRTTDAKGNGLVSMLEINQYFRKYSQSPQDAVDKAIAELTNPSYPEKPVQPPNPPEEVTWVDEWLAAYPELSEYAQNFKNQGFITKEDILTGATFSVSELEHVMKIEKLAHRKKIVCLHESMLREEKENKVE